MKRIILALILCLYLLTGCAITDKLDSMVDEAYEVTDVELFCDNLEELSNGNKIDYVSILHNKYVLYSIWIRRDGKKLYADNTGEFTSDTAIYIKIKLESSSIVSRFLNSYKDDYVDINWILYD